MGTRSLTIMFDVYKGNEDEIAVMYCQYDGYPEGMGMELAEFLSGFEIVNGYNRTTGKIANGGGCLSAQIVAHFKEGVGNIYLHKAGTRDCDEEYRYYIYAEADKPIHMKTMEIHVKRYDKSDDSSYELTEHLLFDGTPEDYLIWLKGKET